MAATVAMETDDAGNRLRFQLELEFVQCLDNPNYLNCTLSELVKAQCVKFIDEQQILHWQHYSWKQMRLQQALAEQQQQNNTSRK
ncbi:hypothetical protein JEQ12_019926 [Ovis aries]|uniref:Mediator of RNA polymerase II transcription subunit 31 n=1 Tax=Ovis aries TaxID=9940 RepID=A0A835ZML3_SHEEP|nr:hypothetical protein JEQ12_019926 [Ovis aries]